MANESTQELSIGETVFVLALGAIGYLVGWYVRTQLLLVGAAPGAIAGALGTGLGVMVSIALIKFRQIVW